jgi:hypothetical protein
MDAHWQDCPDTSDCPPESGSIYSKASRPWNPAEWMSRRSMRIEVVCLIKLKDLLCRWGSGWTTVGALEGDDWLGTVMLVN